MDQMAYEKNFLSMLGYEVEEIPGYNATRWCIFDEENRPVGMIQRKKKRQRGTTVFYYETNVKSDLISYQNTRRLDDNGEKLSYEFFLKERDKKYHVELKCGEESAYLALWSHDQDQIKLTVDYHGLEARLHIPTDHYKVEEVVSFGWQPKSTKKESPLESYSYQMTYTDVTDETKGPKCRKIQIVSDEFLLQEGQVVVREMGWSRGKLTTNRRNFVAGTIEEAVAKEQLGLELLRRLRWRTNALLPFEVDVFEILFQVNPSFLRKGKRPFVPAFLQNILLGCENSEKVLQK